MPPLWQYFFAAEEADEPIAAPKGHGPPAHPTISLQTGGFWGCRNGCREADHGPQQPGLAGLSRARSGGGRVMPPLWQYFERL
jgi:hypothetical protein